MPNIFGYMLNFHFLFEEKYNITPIIWQYLYDNTKVDCQKIELMIGNIPKNFDKNKFLSKEILNINPQEEPYLDFQEKDLLLNLISIYKIYQNNLIPEAFEHLIEITDFSKIPDKNLENMIYNFITFYECDNLPVNNSILMKIHNKFSPYYSNYKNIFLEESLKEFQKTIILAEKNLLNEKIETKQKNNNVFKI